MCAALCVLPVPTQLGLVNELVGSPAELEGAAKQMAADMLATSRLGLQASAGLWSGFCASGGQEPCGHGGLSSREADMLGPMPGPAA